MIPVLRYDTVEEQGEAIGYGLLRVLESFVADRHDPFLVDSDRQAGLRSVAVTTWGVFLELHRNRAKWQTEKLSNHSTNAGAEAISGSYPEVA